MENQQMEHITSYIIQSQEDEIKRIALELHEGVGQTLYSLFTGFQFIEGSIDQPAAKNYLKEMAHLLERTIQEVRLLSVELHPPTLTTLGLVPAIKSYLTLYTSTFGIVVKMENSGEEKVLSEKENITLFRVCQEALANIAKYADTSEAEMMLSWREDSLQIEIRDEGKGFHFDETKAKSSGLGAMKERMKLVGGTCRVISEVGKGTTVNVKLPLKRE